METRQIGVPMEGLAELGRIAATQGAVLLENEGQMLPLAAQDKVAVFGRTQINTYRSGTGSGGAVHVAYTTTLLEGLRNASVNLNEKVAEAYENWVLEHPFDNGGGGWAAEPWFQREMPLPAELVREAAQESGKALVVIGRTAGEDKDNADEPGSYRLTEEEEAMLLLVSTYFDKVAVILNVSNIIDISWIKKDCYQGRIKGLLYVWHGGIEGGNAAADVLTGKVTPSGKLADTIAWSLEAYPSTEGYGDKESSIYKEDIYVGYRYFETFCPQKVQYPFGYGLSYTTFSVQVNTGKVSEEDGKAYVELSAEITNTGEKYAGREVLQVYLEAPQGKLGRPARELIGFAKTGLLGCGDKQTLTVRIPMERLAAYDDGGVTGYRSCYVWEAGEYRIHAGSSVRDTALVTIEEDGVRGEGIRIQETRPAVCLEEAAAPVEAFDRLKPGARKEDGTYEAVYEKVPVRTTDIADRICSRLPKAMEITGDKGIRFKDVRENKASLDSFIAQLSEEELSIIVRGEGMCSAKVTPGTAAAFGGVSDSLLAYGIPVGCAADGPSGIRMDTGAKATQLPIGTLLACSFDPDMVEELFTLQGRELVRNEIDTLLGPGINIHRNPMNGRNFEYFSEDPLVTGCFAAATVRGIAKHGAAGTVKHYACNNQETGRHSVNVAVSERALREIYLKGFEIAVREGRASSIMTSYNSVNGNWAASHYDLVTTLLRGEWGFEGIVMTDWWSRMNDVEKGGEPSIRDTRSMVRAQNDLFMVINNNGAEVNANGDNTLEALENGTLTVGELQRCAGNICRFLLTAPAAGREYRAPEIIRFASASVPVSGDFKTVTETDGHLHVPVKETFGADLSGRKEFRLHVTRAGIYDVKVRMMSEASDRAQMICQADLNDSTFSTFQINGTGGRYILQKLIRCELEEGEYTLGLMFVSPGMQIDWLEFTPWER